MKSLRELEKNPKVGVSNKVLLFASAKEDEIEKDPKAEAEYSKRVLIVNI